jgi:4-diphosphocytidyl-2-C-methyl-D-erythritol kinase
VLQRLALCDRVELEPASTLSVDGFADDTLVRDALTALAAEAGMAPRWRARIRKRIPVAAGLGGGSSDAATALRLANATLDDPLEPARLHELARTLGADVPFFLVDGPQLGEDEGATLTPLELPQDYVVLLVHPRGAAKASTRAAYEAFDARGGADGFEARSAALRDALARVERARDLAALPANDLASSPVTDMLGGLGAFRADVSGAGPIVYGLFHHRAAALAAQQATRAHGRTWITEPAWYG